MRWLLGENSKRILVAWETTYSTKDFFEENLETDVIKGQYVELPKLRLIHSYRGIDENSLSYCLF